MDDAYSSREVRPPLHPSASSNTLSSRISNFSDIAEYETYRDDGPDEPYLRGRESLVSLASLSDGVGRGRQGSESSDGGYGGAPSSWASFTGYGGSGGYEQVPLSSVASAPTRKQSRRFADRLSLKRTHAPIPEEEDGVDLGLLRSAAPVAEEEPSSPVMMRGHAEPAFDLSSAWGPSTWQDEAFVKKLQEHEARGKLTGGLGLGIRTDATMTQSDLLATSPVVERGAQLGRSFSMMRKPSLNRGPTLRQLGQSEANKRGKVIEVIMEEDQGHEQEQPSIADLSAMTGSITGISNQPGMRRSTFPIRQQTTQIFYPQPDWKPFSMRWPWLLFLIVLSAALGGMQEVIYQVSLRAPLVRFHSPAEIPPFPYFAFKFLPTIIAVSYGVLWQVTDFEVKRLEAFYQLSKEGGALADESINVDYITHFSFFRPFRALYCKHYAVAISSITTLLAMALVPTLSAATIVLSPDRDARMKDPLGEKLILVNAVWSRFLTAVLFIIAFLGCVLFYQLQSRRSGLLADVKGIAGLASMAVVSHILMDFKDMDVSTHKDIHHRLKDHRYLLRNSSLAPDDGANPVSSQERDKYKTNMHLSENPHPLMLRAAGCIPFILGIIVFSGLLPVFLFTPANIVTDKAPWFATALAVCIKLSWGGLETDVRMLEPYYILSRRHAPPKTLTLDYTAMPFGWVAIRAAMNGHWLVLFVSFGTVMTEILTVLVTSLAAVEGRDFIPRPPDGGAPDHDRTTADNDINAGQETIHSFWISLSLATFILLYMGLAATVVFIRRRRVFLPRQPNTIASVLAFIHQSKMLYDFVGTSKYNNAQMVEKLESLGKTYGLGWFQGRDGQSHCGIDEEELLSGYKFGYDYSRATKPWEQDQPDWL
ncbi:hypothetical protein GQ53DRAFT_754188 [Thozetella sp. PMI_491]|nr:hypothetical protein GQ53DRAFT_754188 [Thozetella sp. PMI_491]